MCWLAYALCALLVTSPLALSRHDEDFGFDNGDEYQVELTANHSQIAKNGLKRLWGVPDTSAYVGHLFRMEIPKEAFTGEVLTYKVRSEDGRRAPTWLAVDTRHGLISGVPLHHDLGVHAFTVTAHGRTPGLVATDTFTIDVKKPQDKPHSKYGSCRINEERLILVIMVDKQFQHLPARLRARALMDLANFMALEWDEFWIEPYKVVAVKDQAVLMSGPGATQQRTDGGTTAIYLNVGCGEKLWTRHKVLVAGIREQSRDGTLSHVLSLPVLGWRLTAVKPVSRPKRQLLAEAGSGTLYDDEEGVDGDYSGYDEDGDYDETAEAASENVDLPDPAPNPVTPATSTTPPHPHRHHHGDTAQETNAPGTTLDTTFQTELEVTTEPSTTVMPTTTTSSTPVPTVLTSTLTPPPPPITTKEDVPVAVPAFDDTTREPATSTNAIVTEDHKKINIEPYAESSSESIDVNRSINMLQPRFGHSPVIIVPELDVVPTTTETEAQTVIIRASNEVPSLSTAATYIVPAVLTSPSTFSSEPPTSSSLSTTPSPPPATVATTPTTPMTPPPTPTSPPTIPPPQTSTADATQQDMLTTSEISPSTIFGVTTEIVTFNQPPTLKHHIKKMPTTAGKAFRYIIPADLFIDPEDGTNLTLSMYGAGNVPLSTDSWVQFLPENREVYGLPLETHVSKWNFIVEARDSAGATARAPLDITVQEHKSKRTFNHEFVMQFKPVKTYVNAIDWQIRALEGIVNLFRDTDMHHLTVLNVSSSDDLYEFVWTNDTLPKKTCPTDDIKRLMKIAESEDGGGNPSAGLARAMSPELKVARVSWRGVAVCASAPGPGLPDTFPPVPRNQVDLVTASAGHLLVYKVPVDTFFDPEDGNTPNLKLSLRFSDRSEIPEDHWLQFDAKNQEFYGLPSTKDVGQKLYQLVAEDSSNKSAYDSLIVEVVKAPSINPTIEFQMTMEYPYAMIADNANTKRKVVEKLAALFDQTDTSSIRIQNITHDPTTIVWYNTSLPMDRCAKQEIEELRRMVISDERGSVGGALKENVDVIFDKDFKVMSLRFVPLGLCSEQHTKTPKVMNPPTAPETKVAPGPTKPFNADGYTEYLVTFVIPAVVIVCMILLAGIIACVLYRRRRTGKMSVGDEEERQAFRSKGIPVIFQDELEERGDGEPVHKSPVIMREEKPPLLPPAPPAPHYRTSDDGPYRPPPPFTASHTPPRPKATPSYRKPPPYVPP